MLRRSILVAVVALAGLALPAQAQTTLEWKFKEGDAFFLETKSDMQQAMRFMGQEIEFDMGMTMVVKYTVMKKNSDGSVVIEQEHVKADVEADGIGAMIGDAMKQIEGLKLQITLGKGNKVTKLEGLDELIDRIGDDPQAAQMMQSMIGEDAMKKQIEESFAFLPEKSVSKGDKWSRKASIPLGPLGSFTTETNYTYEGQDTVDGKKADKISYKATMTYAPPKKGDAAGGLPFEITDADLKAEGVTGTYYFDAAAGRLVGSELNMKFQGSMAMSAGGQDIEMEMEQSQKTKTRVLDKAP